MKTIYDHTISQHEVRVKGLKIHYLAAGNESDEICLLLHGWPTSSHLWRNLMPRIAQTRRVIAPDLPGFGNSQSPEGKRYDMAYWNEFLESFLSELSIKKVHLVVHDLGGPVGVCWAIHNLQMLKSIVFMNTFLFPDFHWSEKLFVKMLNTRFIKDLVVKPWALRLLLQKGVCSHLSEEDIDVYLAPFIKPEGRKVLIDTVEQSVANEMGTYSPQLAKIKVPVACIYGVEDRFLLNVANTMKRVETQLPQTCLYKMEACGHFLQEDNPEKISELLLLFYGEAGPLKANSEELVLCEA